MEVWQMTATDIQTFANQVKDIVLNCLGDRNKLKGSADEIAGEFILVISKQGWFGKLWDKFQAKTDEDVLKGGYYIRPAFTPRFKAEDKEADHELDFEDFYN